MVPRYTLRIFSHYDKAENKSIGKIDTYKRTSVGNFQGGNHLRKQGVNGRIILKMILEIR
jgi:hypothetical protein